MEPNGCARGFLVALAIVIPVWLLLAWLVVRS